MKGYPIIQEGVYTPAEVAKRIGKDKQTLILWDKYSDERENAGEERLIPRPNKDDKGYRTWTESQVLQIEEFSKNISYGSLGNFSRRRCNPKSDQLEKVD